MKFKTTALLLLALAQPTIAAPTAQPSKCPSFSTLQSLGIVIAVDGWPGWLMMSEKWYEDNNEWQFSTIGLQAKDKENALELLKAELQILSFVQGPMQDKSGENTWACLYGSEEGHSLTMAMTPPLEVPQALPSLFAKFKR